MSNLLAFGIGVVLGILGLVVMFLLKFKVVEIEDDAAAPVEESFPRVVKTVTGQSASYYNIKKASHYEGHPAIIVQYTFSNEKEDPAYFNNAFNLTVYQDNIELSELRYLNDNDSFDHLSDSRKVKNNGTLIIEKAFQLRNQSDIEMVFGPIAGKKYTKFIPLSEIE